MRSTLSLVELIRMGRISPGASLVHKARRFEDRNVVATVGEGGEITYGGNTYKSLSGAAFAVTGKSVDGWTFWRLERTGEQLDRLRRDPSVVSGK